MMENEYVLIRDGTNVQMYWYLQNATKRDGTRVVMCVHISQVWVTAVAQ
jgi:hypothetical protein